jgi:hypothetical protein
MAENASAAQQAAARGAAMAYVVGSQAAGTIQFKAEGSVPTIALPMRIIVIKRQEVS